jgi:hypothetical protein
MYSNICLGKIELVQMSLETIARLCPVVMTVFILSVFSLPSWAGEPLRVALNKTALLRIAHDASTVTIGNPEVADIVVESPRVILIVGKEAGETNLLILDANYAEIHDFDVIVIPQSVRHLTVHRSVTEVTTFNCNPRCTAIKTPGASPSSGGGSSASSGSGGNPLSAVGLSGSSTASEDETDDAITE